MAQDTHDEVEVHVANRLSSNATSRIVASSAEGASLFKLTGAPGNLYIYQMQGLEVKDNLVMKSEEIDEDLKVGAAQ